MTIHEFGKEKHFPETKFVLVKNAGHGGLAPFQPKRLVLGLKRGM